MNYLLAMAAPQDGGGGGGLLGMMLPFLLMLLVIYFLLLRPQQKKQKALREMLGQLKKGDKVITTSGMYATIFGIDDEQNKIILKISEGVKMEFLKSSIAQKVN